MASCRRLARSSGGVLCAVPGASPRPPEFKLESSARGEVFGEDDGNVHWLSYNLAVVAKQDGHWRGRSAKAPHRSPYCQRGCGGGDNGDKTSPACFTRLGDGIV